MVRKRGVARKSFSHRRIRRVQKYDYRVVPRRFKLETPAISARLAPKLEDSVGLEPYVEAELTSMGVPEDEWPYLYGFAKRMLELYRTFTGDTLAKEKQNLINEYVLRGYSLEVLSTQQTVVEVYTGTMVLEGEFTSYAYQWKRSYAGDTGVPDHPNILFYGVTVNKLCIYDENDIAFQIVKLSDGTLLTDEVKQNYGQFAQISVASICGKYFAMVYNDAGTPKLQIYKNGSLLQTINLTTVAGWTSVAGMYHVSFSYDGKYVLVTNWDENEYALFKGS